MKNQEQKNEWTTPELIVLVRSKPEEAVLTACKGAQAPTGPLAQVYGCAEVDDCFPDCSAYLAT
jgi:hypothetical protein